MSETNAERLARIKEENDNKGITSHEFSYAGDEFITDINDDFDWLIEQAEKTEDKHNGFIATMEELTEYAIENKRLLEALEFYADRENYSEYENRKLGLIINVVEEGGELARLYLEQSK